MSKIVVTITLEIPVGNDSWFCDEDDLADMSDTDVIELVQESITGDIEDAAWNVERIP